MIFLTPQQVGAVGRFTQYQNVSLQIHPSQPGCILVTAWGEQGDSYRIRIEQDGRRINE